MTYEHKDVPPDKGANHVLHNWTYANATARTGASGFVSGDLYKLALQTDNNTLWMLTATTPTWVPIGAGSAFMQTLMDDANAATARATLGANIMRFGALVGETVSRTFEASDLGKHHRVYVSSTLTLPPLSVCENGSMLLITCYEGVATISRNGTEALYTTSSVTSFTLNPGDFAILTTNGTYWLATICRATVMPTGSVIAVASETVPTGYLECNGAAVSRTTYADLFAVIGIAHGYGDNSTTFNLPDYRGLFLRGWAHGSTMDPDRNSRTAMNTGGATGDHVGAFQADQFKSHYHSATRITDNLGGQGSLTGSSSSGNTGGAGGNETRPVNANVMYCIKY